MEDKKVLLSIKDLQVKFRVRGRILTAIRGVTLDIYENESIAIVGESGAGKSVFTKAFAGMLDSNGFIDQGDIIFNDAELSDTVVPLNSYAKKTIASTWEKLNEYSKLEYGSEVFLKMKALEQEKEEKMTLSEEEREKADIICSFFLWHFRCLRICISCYLNCFNCFFLSLFINCKLVSSRNRVLSKIQNSFLLCRCNTYFIPS